jgi:hypothetical protein
MFTSKEVLAGLKASLAMLGTILDIGISTEKATGFFMNNGYAMLDIFQPSDTPSSEKYQPLSHQLS